MIGQSAVKGMSLMTSPIATPISNEDNYNIIQEIERVNETVNSLAYLVGILGKKIEPILHPISQSITESCGNEPLQSMSPLRYQNKQLNDKLEEITDTVRALIRNVDLPKVSD